MFTYYLESTQAEREQIERELKELYNQLIEEENAAFLETRRAAPEDQERAAAAHLNASARLGILQRAFDALHVVYEMGRPFEIE